MYKSIFRLISLSLLLVSCSNYTPKPYAYFRIDLPKPTYTLFDSSFPPINFEYSTLANVQAREAANEQEQYIDIIYKGFNGRIYCSYKNIKGDFRQLSEDSRNLVYKHTVRADAIIEKPYANAEANVYGILYQITGNAATPIQFILTDSTKHFLRGALYFNAVPNADSIAPVSAFIEKDLMQLVESLRWKK